MTALPRRYRLGTQQRQALQFLARSPFGAAEADATVARLMRAGLATTQREIKVAGETIGRVRITEAGRRVLEGY
jgi:hypothetical protein